MRYVLWVVCLAIVSSAPVCAQEAELQPPRTDDSFLGPAVNQQPPTDYESSYSRYATARELVFRNAARQAAERRERMAINARFGYSPLRPPSSTMPSMGSPIVPPTALRVYTPYAGMAFPRLYGRF